LCDRYPFDLEQEDPSQEGQLEGGSDGSENGPSDGDDDEDMEMDSVDAGPSKTRGADTSSPARATSAKPRARSKSRFNFAIDEQCTWIEVENMYRQAYSRLKGLKVCAKFPSAKRHHVTIGTRDAQDIVNLFFRSMLGTTMERVQQIAANIEVYNTAQIRVAKAAGADPAAPDAVMGRISVILVDIIRTDMPMALKCLLYQVAIVRLRDVWKGVQASLAKGRGDASSQEYNQYIDYLELGETKTGVGYATVVKTALCKRVGITLRRLTQLTEAAMVPAALVQHFGRGSLLFPKSMNW
jgi:hypothetical protein